MKKQNDNYIYIVLVKALTGLGRFVRLFGGYEYTHIAVSMDESLVRFLTFSRRLHNAPFDSGYMTETLDCYAFGDNKSVKLKVFRIPVTAEKKRKIQRYIKRISTDKEYIFNFLSMVTMPVLKGFRIYKAHNCMSFVGRIIELSGEVSMKKPYYKYDIRDFDRLLTPYFYREGLFYKKSTETYGYMRDVSIYKNITDFSELIGKSLYRLILKRK